jgi:hypothetical protein
MRSFVSIFNFGTRGIHQPGVNQGLSSSAKPWTEVMDFWEEDQETMNSFSMNFQRISEIEVWCKARREERTGWLYIAVNVETRWLRVTTPEFLMAIGLRTDDTRGHVAIGLGVAFSVFEKNRNLGYSWRRKQEEREIYMEIEMRTRHVSESPFF